MFRCMPRDYLVYQDTSHSSRAYAIMNLNDPRQVSRAARLMMNLKPRGNLRNDLRVQFNDLVADITSGKVRLPYG